MVRIFKHTEIRSMLEDIGIGERAQTDDVARDPEHQKTVRARIIDFLHDHESNDPSLRAYALFLYLQEEKDGLPPAHWRRRELQAQEHVLLRHFAGDWFGINSMNGHEGFGIAYVDYRHGLPDTIQISMENFLKHGPQIFREYPSVTGVHVIYTEADIAAGRTQQFAESPLLGNLRSLELHPHGEHISDIALETMLSSPHLEQLESLAVRGWSQLSDEGAARVGVALLGVARPNLKRLDLGKEAGTPEDPQRRERITALMTAGLHAMNAEDVQLKLESLDLAYSNCGEDVVRQLTEAAARIGPLSAMQLSYCGLTTENPVKHICESRFAKTLRHLDVSHNNSAPGAYNGVPHALVHLSKPGALPKLESLNVRMARLTAREVADFAASDVLSHLKSFSVIANHTAPSEGINGWDAFFDSTKPVMLEKLDISDNPTLSFAHPPRLDLTPAHFKKLANNPAFAKLEELDMMHHEAADAKVIHLAEGKLRNLRALALDESDISATGVKAIAKSPLMQTLHTLRLRGNQVTTEAINALASADAALRETDGRSTLSSLTLWPGIAPEWRFSSRWKYVLKQIEEGKALPQLERLYADCNGDLAPAAGRAETAVSNRWLERAVDVKLSALSAPPPPPPPPVSPPTNPVPDTLHGHEPPGTHIDP